MPLGSETPTTDTPGNATQSPTSSSLPGSGFQTQPVYLYAFVFIAILVVSFVLCSLWRGFVIRRRRRELGLPDLEGPYGYTLRPVVPEEKLIPPVMYDVYLRDTRPSHFNMEKKRKEGRWRTLEPISTTLVDTSEDDPPSETHDLAPITFFDMLKELSPHRWRPLRSKRANGEKNADEKPPNYRQVVTSVLIAMPSPPAQRRHVEELPIPEISFGVYDGPWSKSSAAA